MQLVSKRHFVWYFMMLLVECVAYGGFLLVEGEYSIGNKENIVLFDLLFRDHSSMASAN